VDDHLVAFGRDEREIAAVAARYGATLLSADADLARMAEVLGLPTDSW
jgi:predicted nucleic acid-binding protein